MRGTGGMALTQTLDTSPPLLVLGLIGDQPSL